MAAEVTCANTHPASVPTPIPSSPTHQHQAPLFYRSKAQDETYERHYHGNPQTGSNVHFTIDETAPTSALRQALAPIPAPCISTDLIFPVTQADDNIIPFEGECSPPATPQRPRPTRDTRQRVRTASSSSSSSSSQSPSPYPVPLPEPQTTTSSRLVTYTRRNAPISQTDATSSSTALRTNRWACPHCPYVQYNRRTPDLKRHVKSHAHGADVALWVCCGGYAPDAIQHGVPVDVIQQGEVIEFDGLPMIGGCRKTFSRRDALIRHLKARKGRCFGDALSMHQPGNRLEDDDL